MTLHAAIGFALIAYGAGILTALAIGAIRFVRDMDDDYSDYDEPRRVMPRIWDGHGQQGDGK